jgi:hypothetical protein
MCVTNVVETSKGASHALTVIPGTVLIRFAPLWGIFLSLSQFIIQCFAFQMNHRMCDYDTVSYWFFLYVVQLTQFNPVNLLHA